MEEVVQFDPTKDHMEEVQNLMHINLRKYLEISTKEESKEWSSSEFLKTLKGSLFKMKCSEGQGTENPCNEVAYAVDEAKKEPKWINHYNSEENKSNSNIKKLYQLWGEMEKEYVNLDVDVSRIDKEISFISTHNKNLSFDQNKEENIK